MLGKRYQPGPFTRSLDCLRKKKIRHESRPKDIEKELKSSAAPIFKPKINLIVS